MTATHEPLISIVTPFYNTEAYLAECIESVLSQSYEHWEYLLVNNCSTDGSLAIAEKYAATEPRIRVSTNQTFLGQVQNYNHALSLVSPDAKYVKMVQADDFLFPECLERMTALALKNPSVAIVGSYYLRGDNVAGAGLPVSSTVLPGPEICRFHLLGNRNTFGSPTSVLYRADVIRERRPFFNEDFMFEDTEVCYILLEHHDFGFLHQVLTFSRTENDSYLSRINRLDPFSVSKFAIVWKFAPRFLEGEVLRSCLASYERDYLRLLAQRVFDFSGPAFWRFHLKCLGSVNYRIPRLKFAGALALEFLDFILNLKKSAGRMYRAVRST